MKGAKTMTKLQETCINWMTKNYGGKWLYAPHYEKILHQWHVCTVYFESYVKVEIAFAAKGPFVKIGERYAKRNK